MNLKLRTWQKNAIDKALDWFTRNESNSRFLINAAPGGNKYRNKSLSNRACTVSSLHATRDCNFRFIMRCSLLL